ncbi:glycoside hydrolase family 25 protein [Paenibacillus glycanilyticus]|uniref:glycoside hydrolase family 25 protein n=1 Tax=Paenibacillus glycanilyticus TaxID=126569 RepID=UPI000FDA56F2|nr:glycoside hydrolase family 25 protein [Paenibacillus glycanilyticus]
MQGRTKGYAQGIDVSHYQGTIDWPKVAGDGITFAFVKATEGENYKDPTFLQNANGAAAAGLLVGAYHFLRASSSAAAKREAQYFYQTASQANNLLLPPVMDYETNSGNLSDASMSAVAKAFLEETERLFGVKPIFYTGNAFANHFDTSLGTYPLWIARYNASSPPDDAKAWTRWTFWQYSDGSSGGTLPSGTRKVSGISGNVDLNEYAGTEDDLLRAYAPEEDKPMTEAEKQQMEELQQRIAALETHVNISGNQTPPDWTKTSTSAAMKAGIITSVNDKGMPEFITIQMLYNAGLCNAELIKFFKEFSADTRKAIEDLLKKK